MVILPRARWSPKMLSTGRGEMGLAIAKYDVWY